MKLSQKSLLYKFLSNIRTQNLINPGDLVIVALSGGPDSVCLFDILNRLKDELKINLKACHYNHRMRAGDSYNDEVFVKNLCQDNNVSLILAGAEEKLISEEDARDARYAFFEKILREEGRGAKIATAHNADDFVETLLLRLIRGSGLAGLKSIPRQRKNFIRPLLTFSRKEIEEYLHKQHLDYCIDKTNEEPVYDRNFLRLKVLPYLKELNPALIKTLSQAGEMIEEDYDFISQYSLSKFQEILESRSDCEIVLPRDKWLVLERPIKRYVLRLAFGEIASLRDITQKQLSEVVSMLEKGEGEKQKKLPNSLRVVLKSGKIIISTNS